jgi:hypothetical protein
LGSGRRTNVIKEIDMERPINAGSADVYGVLRRRTVLHIASMLKTRAPSDLIDG